MRLDQLKEEISKEVSRPDIEIAVPERQGVALRFSPNINNEQLKAWRRNSTNRKTDELDSIKFSCYVVGNTVVGIYFNEELVEQMAQYAAGDAASGASGDVATVVMPEIQLEVTVFFVGGEEGIGAALGGAA